MIDFLRTSSALRGILPTVVAALVVGVAVARPLSRRLGIAPWHAAWLAVSGTGFLFLTLAPQFFGQILGGTGTPGWCGFAVTLRVGEVLAVTHEWLNALVLLPLGVAVAWLPRRHRRTGILVAALLSPAVEALQGLFASLGRVCSVDDVVLNVGGLVAGLALGALVAAVAPAATARRDDGAH